MDFKRIFGPILKWPLKLFIRSKIIPSQLDKLDVDSSKPIFYVLKHDSLSNILTLQRVCKKLKLPDPFSPVVLNGQSFDRYICLDKLPLLRTQQGSQTEAEPLVGELLNLHTQDSNLDCLLIPAFFAWGRNPGKQGEKREPLFNQQKKPSSFKKFFTIIISGRHNLVQLSEPMSCREVADEYGATPEVAHKLVRVARFHFQRQRLAIAGPRLWQREQLINSLLASPALKKVIEDEAKTKNIDISEARESARQYLDEMAADYREGVVRIADKLLTWIWNKLYHGLNIKHVERVRKLAHDGHEIVYVPCHRSHMDYLLLTYVIYHEGLVPPHIAAGINLNFWPMGSIFRRTGAFFMRRSFRGNKLYSAAFREYLAQLMSKGYAIKYYPESGRSRTGRLLKAKTGMLAMTVQSALRGIDRPITLVPVYIGYEHVMEVSTYMQELSGQAKKKESVWQVLGILGKLRNFGQGFVNFGEPIHLNKELNKAVPEWRDDQHPTIPQKPTWFPNFVAQLCQQVMCNINDAAALNGVNLSSLVLLAAPKHSLFKDDLIEQLDLCINLLADNAPFENLTLPPTINASLLLDDAIGMEKFNVESGKTDIISLDDNSAVLQTYYRNNILHLYLLPSFVAACLISKPSNSLDNIKHQLSLLLPILSTEYYLNINEQALDTHLNHIYQTLTAKRLIKIEGDKVQAVDHSDDQYQQLHLLSTYIQETIQRYAIVLASIANKSPLSRADLEKDALAHAKQLAKLHGIKGPEFVDKSILSQFILQLREASLLETDEQGLLNGTNAIEELTQSIFELIDGDVLHTIKHPA